MRSVMDLITAQSNLAAALLVVAQNFDTNASIYHTVIAAIALNILMPKAGRLGKRMQ